MTCIAIIGIPRTKHTLEQAIAQAQIRGMEVVLLDRASALKGCAAPPSTAKRIALERLDVDTAVEALAKVDPRFVVSFSEFNLLLAAEIRERLGLHGASAQAVRRTRCKHETRRRLKEWGLTRAKFAATTLATLDETLARFQPPFVIKPASMTGSIGVHAVRCREDVAAFKERFVSWEAEAARDRPFVVETFLRGDEYSVEGICHEGVFHLIAVTGKHTDGFPNFAETGHILPARDRPMDFAGFIGRVATALELDATPVHAEVKVLGTEIELIEIHARFGGDLIPLLIEKALGYNVFGAYYDTLLDQSPPPPGPPRVVAGIRFLHPGELQPVAHALRSWPEVDYCLQVNAAGRHEAEREADNIRILNSRIGHLLFTATGHDAAEAFFANLDPTRLTVDTGEAA